MIGLKETECSFALLLTLPHVDGLAEAHGNFCSELLDTAVVLALEGNQLQNE
jgi:hypothetical protein